MIYGQWSMVYEISRKVAKTATRVQSLKHKVRSAKEQCEEEDEKQWINEL